MGSEGSEPTLDNRCRQLPVGQIRPRMRDRLRAPGLAQLAVIDRLEALAADQFGGLLVGLAVFATSQRTRPLARKVEAAGQAAK